MAIRPVPFALLFALALHAPLDASTQLSEGLPFSDVQLLNVAPALSADGRFAVYRYDAVIDGAAELWSVALAGGAPVRLSYVLQPNQQLDFRISPASNRVVYRVDQDTPGKPELWSVPIGGGTSTRLNPPLASGRQVLSYEISPAGDRVLLLADTTALLKFELWSVPIAGGDPIKLNPTLGADRTIANFRISPDGERAVYRVGRTVQADWELWSVPVTGGTAIKISRPVVLGGNVSSGFRISPDGSFVVYLADAVADEMRELWSVPITGGDSAQLNGILPFGASVSEEFQIAPTGGRVAFRADQSALGRFELWSAPLAGGTPVRLNATLPAGGIVESEFAFSPDGSRVIYRAEQAQDGLIELFAVPATGGAAIRLSGELVSGGDVLDFAISPNGSRVVYRADASVDGRNELFSAPLAGGAATRISRVPVANGDVVNYRIGSTSEWVVYGGDIAADLLDEIYRVPIAGGSSERVNGPLAPGGDVVLAFFGAPAFEISAANGVDVIYVADETFNDQFELYLADAPGAPSCVTAGGRLCLQNGRFEVEVAWRDFAGSSGSGQATALSNESGDFWFFDPESNEMIVKILDACGANGRYWVAWRALSNVRMDLSIRDTETGQILTYHNPLGFQTNGHLDIDTIFHCDGSGPASRRYDTELDLPAPGAAAIAESVTPTEIGPCVPDGDRAICLRGGRFRVSATFRDFAGNAGDAHLIPKNDSSGYAWFFGADNYELLFKLIDGCSFNDRFWVFAAGLTNVEVELEIVDRWSGTIYRQSNALGVEFPTNLDIGTAFDDCAATAP